jgi:hypothetical protein
VNVKKKTTLLVLHELLSLSAGKRCQNRARASEFYQGNIYFTEHRHTQLPEQYSFQFRFISQAIIRPINYTSKTLQQTK